MSEKRRKLNMQSSSEAKKFTVQDEIRRDRRIRQAGQLRKARTGVRRVLTALLCMAVCVCLVVAAAALVMRTQNVTVSGNARYSSEELLSAANVDGDVLPLIREKQIYERLAERFPYVDSVQLIKTYPSTLEIVVRETEAVFATRVHGRSLSLDSRLRVMDYTEDIDGLIYLELPPVQTAIEGSRIVFAEQESDTFVSEMLSMFFPEEERFLTALDLRDRYSITGRVENRAKIIFGDYRNVAQKLELAKSTLASAEEDYSKRTLIDVSATTFAAVQYEYQGEF